MMSENGNGHGDLEAGVVGELGAPDGMGDEGAGYPKVPLEIETGDDVLDAWLRSDVGRVPGGELVGYPAETSDVPMRLETDQEAIAFAKKFVSALDVVSAITDDQMQAIVEEAKAVLEGSSIEDEAPDSSTRADWGESRAEPLREGDDGHEAWD